MNNLELKTRRKYKFCNSGLRNKKSPNPVIAEFDDVYCEH